jgi:hypothetical protein
MSAHISDEQFTRYLSGAEDAHAQSHLQECEECRAQAKRLLDLVGALRAHAERSGARHSNFWALQRNEVRYALAIRRPQRPTWVIASAMAALVFLSTFMFRNQEPRQQPNTGPQVSATNADDGLLSEVNSTLEQEVPSALVPVQRLAYEREQAERVMTGRN